MSTHEEVKESIIKALYEFIESIKNENTCKDYSMERKIVSFKQVYPNHWEKETQFIVRRTEIQEITRKS